MILVRRRNAVGPENRRAAEREARGLQKIPSVLLSSALCARCDFRRYRLPGRHAAFEMERAGVTAEPREDDQLGSDSLLAGVKHRTHAVAVGLGHPG